MRFRGHVWAAVLLIWGVTRALAEQNFIPPGGIILNTGAETEITQVEADVTVTSTAEEYFVLAQLFVTNQASNPCTLIVRLHNQPMTVPDSTLTFQIGANANNVVVDNGIRVTGVDLGIGPETWQLFVTRQCSKNLILGQNSYLGIFLLDTVSIGGGGGGSSLWADLQPGTNNQPGDFEVAQGTIKGTLNGVVEANAVSCVGLGCVTLGTETTGDYIATVDADGGLSTDITPGGEISIAACPAGEIMKSLGSGAWDCATDDNTPPGGGITSLNGLTAGAQTFVLGTVGSDVAIDSTGSTHTFTFPDASATARGLVTANTQTFAGAKTFSTGITCTDCIALGSETSGAYVTAVGTNAGLDASITGDAATIGLKDCATGQILEDTGTGTYACADDDNTNAQTLCGDATLSGTNGAPVCVPYAVGTGGAPTVNTVVVRDNVGNINANVFAGSLLGAAAVVDDLQADHIRLDGQASPTPTLDGDCYWNSDDNYFTCGTGLGAVNIGGGGGGAATIDAVDRP